MLALTCSPLLLFSISLFFFLFNSSSRRNSKLEPNINPNRSFPFEPSPFRPFISSPFTSWELALESVRVANLNLGRSSNVQITGYRYRFSTFRCKHTDGHHSSHETTVADGNSSTLALHPVTPFPGIFFRFSVTLQRLIFPFHSGPRLLRENRSTLALPPSLFSILFFSPLSFFLASCFTSCRFKTLVIVAAGFSSPRGGAHRSKGTAHRSLQFKNSPRRVDCDYEKEDEDEEEDDEGCAEACTSVTGYVTRANFPAAAAAMQRHNTTTTTRFGHRGGEIRTHERIARGRPAALHARTCIFTRLQSATPSGGGPGFTHVRNATAAALHRRAVRPRRATKGEQKGRKEGARNGVCGKWRREPREREREERSTWKLCGGVKLQRPPRCLPFAGDIRNSSVVTAPNRGVDPLDRCIYTMGGRGKGDAPLTRNARSPRTPRPVIFTRHEVFRRLYRRSLRRERERTKFRDLFSPLAFSFQDFQEARDGGKSMKKGRDWIPVSKKQKIGNPKSRRGFRSYSSFPVFAYTEEGRETMRLMGKVEIRSKGRRRREHATTTRRDRDIYIYI